MGRLGSCVFIAGSRYTLRRGVVHEGLRREGAGVAVRSLLSRRADPYAGTMTIQLTPKRSVAMPKHGE